MKTNIELANYMKDKKTGNESFPGMAMKHFKVIENSLLNDENVLTCFMLLYGNTSKRIAGALTNKRLIIAQGKFIGNQLITISINNINDIYIKNGLINSTLVIDSLKETIQLKGLTNLVKNANSELNIALNEIKNGIINNSQSNNVYVNQEDNYDKLKKLKSLLDENIISQEEFEKEKQKLLQ